MNNIRKSLYLQIYGKNVLGDSPANRELFAKDDENRFVERENSIELAQLILRLLELMGVDRVVMKIN